MYAVVKTIEEANQLNDYIKAWYYNDIGGANFDKWTDVIPVKDGYALQILSEWKDYPVPDCIINGIEFVDSIDNVV